MEYLIFAAVVAAVLGGWILMKNRAPRNPMKSVKSFSRARDALKPEVKRKDGPGS